MADNTVIENELQFNIGKSYGLEANHLPIENYQKNLDSMSVLFQKKMDEDLTKYKKICDDMELKLQGLFAQANEDYTKVQNHSTQLITTLSALLTDDIKKAEWLQQNVQETFTNIFERHEQFLASSFSISDDIKQSAKAFSAALKSSAELAERRVEEHLSALKSKNIDLTDTETGYQFGLALKTALESGH